jgi:branched-chain amino acid transport system permease protein
MDAAHLTSLAASLATSIAVLLLLSIGLAIVFGMRGIINLAHGEFVMVGAYAAVRLTQADVPFAISVLLAGALVGCLGVLVERLIIRHLYSRPIDCMLATFGLSLVLVQAVTLIYGPTTPGLAIPLGNINVGQYTIGVYNLLLIGAAATAVAVVAVWLRATAFGLRARATARSSGMAAALGVNTSLIDTGTFGLGSLFAGLAGGLLSPFLGVAPTMGQNFTGEVFMTVLVGGGNFLVGTPAAAGLLGGAQNVLATNLTPVMGQVGLLLLAVAIVRLRPQGLAPGLRVS